MNRIIKAGEQDLLASKLRAAFPFPGTDYDKFMTVTLKPGESVEPHAHKRHAVLYYPHHAGPVVIYPNAGTMLYLPPGTVHDVPAVERERVSIAMLVSP